MTFENPFAGLFDDLGSRYVKKLTLEEQCGYYAALQLGVNKGVVGLAANISPMAVNFLLHAGEVYGNQIHYARVADEWAKMGQDAFCERYMTAALRERILDATDRYKRGARHNPRGSRRPDAYDRVHKLKGPFNVHLVEIRACPDDPTKHEWLDTDRPEPRWRGDPRKQEERFASGRAAYDFIRLRFAWTDEELDSGAVDAAIDDTWFDKQEYLKTLK